MLLKESGRKINFIDENDCFVGFDFNQCCCESFGYSVTLDGKFNYHEDESLPDFNFDGYNFDTSFTPDESSDEECDDCQYVTLKMINSSGDVAYLHLYNMHNGYYSHGWKTSWGCEGYL
ncbi:MAG: hypothetical protein ACRCVE_02040 [Plesiomonas sp.]